MDRDKPDPLPTELEASVPDFTLPDGMTRDMLHLHIRNQIRQAGADPDDPDIQRQIRRELRKAADSVLGNLGDFDFMIELARSMGASPKRLRKMLCLEGGTDKTAQELLRGTLKMDAHGFVRKVH